MAQKVSRILTEKSISAMNQQEVIMGLKSAKSEDKKDPKRPFVVAIEGNIGSGKSTMINYFKNFNDIQIHPEPIEKW